jgi:hypothetical protein
VFSVLPLCYLATTCISFFVILLCVHLPLCVCVFVCTSFLVSVCLTLLLFLCLSFFSLFVRSISLSPSLRFSLLVFISLPSALSLSLSLSCFSHSLTLSLLLSNSLSFPLSPIIFNWLYVSLVLQPLCPIPSFSIILSLSLSFCIYFCILLFLPLCISHSLQGLTSARK